MSEEIRELLARLNAWWDAQLPLPVCGSTKKLIVDHDHQSGTIRGVLCNQCNVAIGQFGDDSNRLRSAADYLERHRG